MEPSALFDAFADNLDASIEGNNPRSLAVAVSGGSDSTALLLLSFEWAKRNQVVLRAVSVDHGLRDAAKEELKLVSSLCRELGVSHDILRWRDWDKRGNLMDEARKARQNLIADFARNDGIAHILLGHTLDDQAETLLMRLARGSGIDGLSGMFPRREYLAVTWLRPLLPFSRAGLRDFLLSQDVPWSDDPTNDDLRFDRVKMRKALALLAPLGIDIEGLAETASRMQLAREALEIATQTAAQDLAEISPAGDVLLKRAGLLALPDEIKLRLLSHCLKYVSSSTYRPRLMALKTLTKAIGTGGSHTLMGCLVTTPEDGMVHFGREPNAVANSQSDPADLWDNRWRLTGADPASLEIRALGEAGLKLCKNWRQTGLPRESLVAGPAVWRQDRLIAAPLAGFENGWTIRLEKGPKHFLSSVLSH